MPLNVSVNVPGAVQVRQNSANVSKHFRKFHGLSRSLLEERKPIVVALTSSIQCFGMSVIKCMTYPQRVVTNQTNSELFAGKQLMRRECGLLFWFIEVGRLLEQV